jgi:hypothetical protein
MYRVLRLSVALGIVLALAIPAAVAAEDVDDDRGVVIRINGDAVVAQGEDAGLALVVNGNLDVNGTAGGVIIINGTATIAGGRVEGVLAVNSTVNLTDGAIVEDDVVTVNSTVNQTNGTVGGEVREWEPDQIGVWLMPVFAFFSLVFLIGGALLILIAGLLAAAIAPVAVRRTGWLIGADTGNTILAGLAFWFGLPLLAVLAIATLVGMPIGFAILFGLLPVVASLGALVGGIRFGDWLVLHLRGAVEPDRPYLASFLGLGALILLGVVPFVGGLAWLVAGFLGSGAITLAAWRSMRGRPILTPRPAVTAVATAPGAATPGAAAVAATSVAPAPPPALEPPVQGAAAASAVTEEAGGMAEAGTEEAKEVAADAIGAAEEATPPVTAPTEPERSENGG